MKIMKIIMATLLAFTLSGCGLFFGEKVEVPPASVGMVLGKNGYEGDIIPPSRFRLDVCLANCDKLVVIEAGDVGMKETMEVLMPKDNLIFEVDVRFTLEMSKDQKNVLTVFDRVLPRSLESGNYGVTLEDIYLTYGQAVVRNVVRAKMSEYSIAEVAENQGAVSEALRESVSNALQKTPLDVAQFGLARMNYPSVVREAMEATQERKIAIEREEANAQVDIRRAQAQLEVRRAERAADILAAETIAESNRIMGENITPEVIRYLELQALNKMAENKNTIFFPVEMLGTEALNKRVLESNGVNQ